MNLQRVKTGLGVVVIGVALALAPSAPAWAGSHKVEKQHKKHHKSTTRHSSSKTARHTSSKTATGSDTGSSFCQLDATTRSEEGSALETAATNALVAGNWSVAQKDLLTIDKETAPLEQEFLAALSSAPANVKAAAAEIVKFIPAEEKAVQDSTSAAQFEQAEQAAVSGQFTSASQVLAAYETAQCGSTTTTT